MSDTPRTKAATRMAFTSEYMVEIEEAQKMERELADMTKQIDPYEREAAKAAINVLKRELAEVKKENERLNAVADEHITRYHETCLKLETALFGTEGDSFAQVAKQRDKLAATLKSLCKAIISEEPQDITDLFKQSGAAIAATKGGSDE